MKSNCEQIKDNVRTSSKGIPGLIYSVVPSVAATSASTASAPPALA
jgi:hypothetical protein